VRTECVTLIIEGKIFADLIASIIGSGINGNILSIQFCARQSKKLLFNIEDYFNLVLLSFSTSFNPNEFGCNE